MTKGNILLSDQVFQLNAFLWSLWANPPQESIRPVLREAGYYLVAIGRRVLPPDTPSVINALERLTGSPSSARSPCNPDIWLKHREDATQPVVELKGRAFSPDSSNSKQAVKLLVSAFDLAPSLGDQVEHPGHIIYATPCADSGDMETTLSQLAERVRDEGVPPAPTAVIGLSIEDDGVAMSSPTPSDLPEPAKKVLASPAIVLSRDGNNDFRPLYLVPWIPGIKESQDSDLHKDGLRELTARVLTHAQGYVGRARVPTIVTLDGGQLLRDATFGIFDQWREDRELFIRKAVDIVMKALKPPVSVRRIQKGLDIDLGNTEHQDKAIKCLRDADPGDPTANLAGALQEQLFNPQWLKVLGRNGPPAATR